MVATILGNSWIAGRNFSCRSQTLSGNQQGMEPGIRVRTRERGSLFDVSNIVNMLIQYAYQYAVDPL